MYLEAKLCIRLTYVYEVVTGHGVPGVGQFPPRLVSDGHAERVLGVSHTGKLHLTRRRGYRLLAPVFVDLLYNGKFRL